MNPKQDYLGLNRALWDDRAPAHAASPDYLYDRLVAEPSSVSGVVEFDRPLLGDLTGVRGVHLQCHIGTDTLSLTRLGARMSGVDFSSVSLEQARRLAAAARTEIDYHCADVYSAADVLAPGSFDLVYTGIGALCWLPRIGDWATVVSALLKPGGRLFLREAHPVLWALDDRRTDGLLVTEYDYFERPEPLVWEEQGTYVSTDLPLTTAVIHVWNHGLGDIIGALLAAGMELTGLVEHQSVPWDALPGQMTRLPGGEWQLADRPWRLPHSYTLQARKVSSR